MLSIRGYLTVYGTLMQGMLRHASITAMPTIGPQMGIGCKRQFAHGEGNKVLFCHADVQLSPRISKPENGRIS